MDLFVLMQLVDGKYEFYRGDPDGKRWNSGKRRNIRSFKTIGLAESSKKQNGVGNDDSVVIVKYVEAGRVGQHKAEAIKSIKELTGCSLAEAKAFYEEHHV